MRNLIKLPFLLIAAWNHPLQGQWANPLNPTGLPRHLLKPVELAVSVGENSHGVAISGRTPRSSLVRDFRHQGEALRSKQVDVLAQVRRKFRYWAGEIPGELILPV
jgi:hypothetical protein